MFGEVVWIAIDERVLRDGRPGHRRLRPIARLGANEWSAVGEVTVRRRVPYAELREGA